MSINVEDLSRKELEDVVIKQSQMLQWQEKRIKSLEESLEESEEQYLELGNRLLHVRQILSC